MKIRFHSPLLLSVLALACSGPPPAVVDRTAPREIRFPATVNTRGFEHGPLPGYHAIVFRGGRAADSALFRAEVADTAVLDALEGLGAEPGDLLGLDTWDERDEPGSPAPDRVLAGPRVEILVRLPDEEEPIPLGRFLRDPGGRGLEMRFGGHRRNIPAWRSGCIACLYSCPGSKVGNARYTVRDFVQGTTRFTVEPGVLPPDGTRVEILLRFSSAPPSPQDGGGIPP